VIDTLAECLAALSQSNIDAYLESFESDDAESCMSDLEDFDDYGSEENNEVGMVFGRCLILCSCRYCEFGFILKQ
jgi:hypothetical protein